MTPSDAKAFSELVTNVMAFYGKETSSFALGVWWSACQPYSLEQVGKAFTRHATNPDAGQFPPKPADIIRTLSGTTTDRSMVAWGKAHDAACRVGAYTDVVFDDPVIHAVIEDLDGWPKFCRTESKDLGYLQHRFCESYRAYAARGMQSGEYPRRLGGDRSPDHDYTRRGLPLPRPAVVGDKERAKLTYQNGGASGKTQISTNTSLVALASTVIAGVLDGSGRKEVA